MNIQRLKWLFILIIMLFVSKGFSQCLIANVNIGDCSSCYKGITLLNADSIKIPMFVVFKESHREDSIEIEKRFKFNSIGFQLLFNNELYFLTKDAKNTSTLSYYDDRFELEWKKDLKNLNKKFVQDSIYSLDLLENNEEAVSPHYAKDFYYKFDQSLGNVKVYNYNDSLVQRMYSSEFPFDKLLEKLDSIERKMMLAKGIALNQQAVGFVSKYLWHQMDANDNIYLLFQYANFVDTVEELTHDKICIAKFHWSGGLIDIYPIMEMPEYTITDIAFLLQDEETIYILTHDYRDWIKKKSARGEKDFKFLTEYKLIDGKFVFQKQSDYLLPKIYEKKYFENILSLGPATYPVLALPLSNELYHLEKDKRAYLINDSLFETQIDYEGSYMDTKKDPIYILNSNVNANKEFMVVYRYSTNRYISIYDENLNLKTTKSLDKWKKFVNLSYAFINKNKNCITFYEYSPGKKLTLPISAL